MRAFQEADALDFYGRDTLINQLIKHLSGSRFLAVVGPSGSGKSSVVKAGMIPALRQGVIRGSDKWFVAEMVPGTHPLEELELALWPVAVDPPPSLVEPMQRDPRGMLRTIRRIFPNEEEAQLLLVIDQFEELWSLTPKDRRQHFLDSLLAALSALHSPLHVIITLRADFYDRPLQYQPIRQFFLRLITLGEGASGVNISPDTRRRVLRSELEAINLDNEQSAPVQVSMWEIINRFGAARLLTFDHDPLTRQPTVEVAHEALLREWGQLCRWLDESRDDIRLQRSLATAVSEWQRAEQNQGYLLRGARLIQYERWAMTTTVALTVEEQAFLTASSTAQEQRQVEEAARQQRELATARNLAASERQRADEQVRATRKLRRRAVYLSASLVVAALLALVAIYAGIQATDNAQTAVANASTAATQEALAAARAEEAQKSANLAATAEANAEAERSLAQKNEAAAIAAEIEAVAQADIARFNEAQAQSLALTTSARQA